LERETAYHPCPSVYSKTIFCACCLGLSEENMDVTKPDTEYHGAEFNWHGPDRQKPNLTQTLECVWIPKDRWPRNDQRIAAIMGAGYFISKGWFLYLDALRFLRSWGGDELMLSMKSWLAGGEVRMLDTVRIGHKFPYDGQPKLFNPPVGHVIWNKLFAAHTLFPSEVSVWIYSALCSLGRDGVAAFELFKQDFHIVQQERARNASIFVHDAHWLADKFHIPLP
jgi:hypothetical protein